MRKPLHVLLPLLALAACGGPPLKDYAYPKWGFVADFPAPPEVTETPPGPGQPHSLLLESKAGGRDFVVSVGEGVRPDVTIDQIGPDYARRAAKGMGGELGVASYASTGQGVLGREYAITKDGRPYATLRAFVANGRFYEIGAQSPFGPDDRAVKDFLDLFRITSAPPAVPPPPAATAPANGAPANAT